MEFCIGSKFNENPVAQDIIRAIDAIPFDEDWFISLEADNNDIIEARALKGGGFQVISAENAGWVESVTAVDTDLLKVIFLKFLDGDSTWRAHCEWQAQTPQQAPTASAIKVSNVQESARAKDKSSGPPLWLGILIGCLVAGIVVMQIFPAQVLSIVPFANSAFFVPGLIASLVILGALIFVVVKIIEARRTAHWPKASGRIVRAAMEARHVQRSNEPTSIKNVPVVEYEFSVLGKKWSGHRINVLGESATMDAAATLARYRVGAIVSVHYDPADPANCVLEHELPEGFGKGCAISLAILAAIIGAVVWGVTSAPALIAVYKPEPRFFFALAAGGFGLMSLLMFFAIRRGSIEARSWPVVRGKIVSSGVETFTKHEDGRARILYTAAVEYAYSVQGAEYHSRQIALAVESSGSQSHAAAIAARYRVDGGVDVRYDPKNPANAALELGGNLYWIIFGVAAACFALAAYTGGLFG